MRNGQNDIIGLLDNTGAKVANYVYDSWGKLISIKDAAGNVKTTDTTFIGYKNPYRYRGYRYDSETALYYLQSRYYDPEWGRFINADEQINDGSIIGVNLFAYCYNNPVNNVDIDGREAITLTLFALYVVGTVAVGLLAIAAVSTPQFQRSWNKMCQGIYIAISQGISSTIYSFQKYKTKAPNLPSYKKIKIDMPHILGRHSSGGNQGGPNKDRFPKWMTAPIIERAVREAYRYGEKIKTQGDSVLVRGFSKTYNMVIEMWVNIKDKIIETAYPK